jgi:hypothetical protein
MDQGEQWAAAMRAENFGRAWEISDRLLCEPAAAVEKHTGPRHLQRIWRGEPIENARVLVRCYHGLGDTIQFIRFAAPLRRIAREVIVWCQPELQGLIRGMAHIDRVLPLHDGAVDAAFDVDIEIMELPHALRASAAGLGAAVPYLSVAAERLGPRPSGLRVGVVWRAGGWDPRRTVPRNLLEPLALLDHVQLYSLSPGADLQASCFTDWSSPSTDTLARRMAGLDVILTVDTTTAHLAGALGLRVWTLLHHDADWRWGTGRHFVWYPTMRLFRQTLAGDWSGPVREVANELPPAFC